MSDDDAPDIPPALSANQWKQARAYHAANPQVIKLEEINSRLVLTITDEKFEADALTVSDVAGLAALIALANEALRRFDDPRAFRREHVRLIRSCIQRMDADEKAAWDGGDDEKASEINEATDNLAALADALDSMLPPRKEGE